MSDPERLLPECNAPAWGPLAAKARPRDLRDARDAALYLAHTENGTSIRSLARDSRCHPSTVLRAVRRIEARRDDPLFERLLERLTERTVPEGRALPRAANDAGRLETKSALDPVAPPAADTPPEVAVQRAARRILRRLGEPDAFLLIAPGAAKAGVFRAAGSPGARHDRPIALVEVTVAMEFLRRDWIRLAHRGAATARYTLTAPGRAALKRLLAEERAARAAAEEGPSAFQAQHAAPGTRRLEDDAGRQAAVAVNLAEAPLTWLARRKGPDGQPFLAAAEVEAGERLRQDFEVAQLGPSVAQDWRRFLAPSPTTGAKPAGDGPSRARERVSAALSALGPGLSDVALRVCCFLEGLERCERRFGWSARSGKVVLKIALQRLVQHYGLDDFRR